MELIDRDVLFNSFNDCSCECGVCQYSLDGLPCGLIENAPTVEAIPKAQYDELKANITMMRLDNEARLKTDMVAVLTEIQLEIRKLWDNDPSYIEGVYDSEMVIQQKINALKENYRWND